MPDINFDKMIWRDTGEFNELMEEFDKEGDVLILDPHQIPDHIPNIDFSKYVGRPVEEVDEDLEHDELVLEPKRTLVEKRIKGGFAFDKQLGRPEEDKFEEEDPFVLDPSIPAVPNDPSMPRVNGAPIIDK